MIGITGGCACGAVRYEGDEAPGFSFLCHCEDCQKMTGTSHAAGFVYPKSALRHTGALAHWTRTAASGKLVTTYRCATCGAPMWNDPERVEGMVTMSPATLDDPNAFVPQNILYAEAAPSWGIVPLPDNTER